MRCPDCTKFVSMDNGDPEVNESDIVPNDATATVTASVHLVRNCADCGTELKALDVDADEADFEVPAEHRGEGHNLSVEVTANDVNESGGGRYKKNYITVDLDYSVSCDCGGKDKEIGTGTLTCTAAAGEFEESV